MGELTGLLDILIDLFTKRNERHNRALRDIMDLSRDIEEFLVKYNLQEKNSDFRLIPENIGQAKIEVITIAYKTRKRIKTAKDIKSKDLPPLLEEVHSDLEMVKRALFSPALGNAVLGEVVSKLHKSFNQLINEASNIEAEEARKRERKEIEQQTREQIKRKVEEVMKGKKAKGGAGSEAKEPQGPMRDIRSEIYEGDMNMKGLKAELEAVQKRLADLYAQQAKEAQKQAEPEAKLAPKEEKKRKAEEVQQAKEAQKQAEPEAKLALKEEKKRKAEEAQQAKEAQKQAEPEAKLASKEEKERKAEEAQQAKDTEKREAEEVAGAELYEGTVKLTVVSPVYLGQMRKLVEYLHQVQDLRLEMIRGSVDEDTAIVVSVAKPIPLTDILREMPPVEQAFKKGNGIQIVLEAE